MSEKVELHVKGVEQTKKLGRALVKGCEGGIVIGLNGPLGAGKTCLVQGAGEELGVEEGIVSPTFTMLNEYHSGRLPLYHLDLYRLKDDVKEGAVELLRLELEEIWQRPGVVMVEWAEYGPRLLPEDYLLIEIDYFGDDDGRSVSISANGPRALRLIQDINSRYIYR
jgi:tRNA threonylcarbamoyladenosine biosynthesis protein TsaE